MLLTAVSRSRREAVSTRTQLAVRLDEMTLTRNREAQLGIGSNGRVRLMLLSRTVGTPARAGCPSSAIILPNASAPERPTGGESTTTEVDTAASRDPT